MATKNSNCPKCRKSFYKNQNSICCDSCENWFHLKCSSLSTKTFKVFCDDPNKKFICFFCKNYLCRKCSKPVFNHHNSLCCDNCNFWTHLKCSGLNLDTYNSLTQSNSSASTFWFCNVCNVLPFSELSDIEFCLLYSESFLDHQHDDSTPMKFSKVCSVCTRKIKDNKCCKALKCTKCVSFVHRKCSGINISDLNKLPKSVFQQWSCTMCYKDMFPFHEESDECILSNNFNSNFDCSCKKTTLSRDLVFAYNRKLNVDNKYGPDPNDLIENTYDTNTNFDYYSMHDFHKLVKNYNDLTNKNFSLFHTNIQSLSNKFEKLQLLLTDLDYKFHIIALSETWYSNNSVKLKPPHLEGYYPYVGIAGHTLKAGCGFYINTAISYIERTKLDVSVYDANNEYEAKWIEIVNTKTANILIGVIYRHPRKAATTSFTSYIKETINLIKKEHKHVILTGDFNYCLLKYTKDKIITEFVDQMYELNLQPCILEPSRITGCQKPSLIDNIFTNIVEAKITAGNLTTCLSDHMPNFMILEKAMSYSKKAKLVKRDFTNFIKEDYLNDLRSINIDCVINVNDMDAIYDVFHMQLTNIIDKHAPFKTFSNREAKWLQKPWISKGIRKSLGVQHKMYNKYIKDKDLFWFNRYKFYRNKIRRLLFLAKELYHK